MTIEERKSTVWADDVRGAIIAMPTLRVYADTVARVWTRRVNGERRLHVWRGARAVFAAVRSPRGWESSI